MSRRSRKQQEAEGDRSHIPREERSYIEYHPALLTHLGLHIVRQADTSNKRAAASANGQPASITNGRSPASSHNAFPQIEANKVRANGAHTPTASQASNELSDVPNGDGFAFRRQLLLNTDNDNHDLLNDTDVFDSIEPIASNDTPVTHIETLAIDPALLEDVDEIAAPSETAQSARLASRVRASFDSVMSTPVISTPRNGSTRGSIAIAPSDRFLRSEVSAEEKYERLRKEEGFAIGKLHEPVFRKLDNTIYEQKVKLTSNAIAFGYQADRPYERPEHNYVRAMDIPESQLADRVEYDMDEQDDNWLEQYNDARRIRDNDAISREVFEITLTKIEKEWTNLEKLMPKPERKDEGPAEDAKCAICDDGECENTNAIVFCDGCNLAVHQDCYGVPYIPEGQWLCRKCFASPMDPVQCLFCPSTTGAFKQTSDLHWAHLLCTNWIPEVAVGNPVFMEPIEGVQNIPSSRWKLTCYICKLKVGACIQCNNKNCYTPFHVSCARRAKLFLQYVPASLQSTGKAFCDKHAPEEYRAEVDMESAFIEAQNFFVTHTDINSQAIAASGTKGKFTISLKRSKQSAVIPAVVYAEILSYMQKFRIRNKADYIADMCKYWSLKRRSRRGQSLLKRLQLQIEDVAANKTEDEHMAKKLEFAKVLLHELDQYHRVLLDSIAERENLKKERSEMRDAVIETIYLPLQPVLNEAAKQLQAIDSHKLLLQTCEGVQELQDNRITWSRFLDNIANAQYLSVAMFETDVNAVLAGIFEAYEDPTCKEHKLAKKLTDRLPAILQECHDMERARALNPGNMTATVFDEEFEPDGLSIREGRPWNWVNRDASPLSDLGDSDIAKLETALTPAQDTPKPKKKQPKTAEKPVAKDETPKSSTKACPGCRKKKCRCNGLESVCHKNPSNPNFNTPLRQSLIKDVLEKSLSSPRLSRSQARELAQTPPSKRRRH